MTNDELRQILRKFIGDEKPTMLATVKSVDKEKCTCSIEDDGIEYFNVRLRAITGKNTGIVMYPKIGTDVLVVKIESTEEWAVIYATEYESIEIEIDSLVINGGKNGGLVTIGDLKDNLDKLRDFVKDLATNIYTWGSVLDSLAGGVVATNQTAWNVIVNTFQFKDMEDTKIKH